jgi:hypothetical protein
MPFAALAEEMRRVARRDSKRTRLALGLALLGTTAVAMAGCGGGIDPNGCSSTQLVVDFPKAIDPDTTVRLTINGHAYELVCPRQGTFDPTQTEGYSSVYVPVTGGGIGLCSTNAFTLYLSDKPPSQIVDVSLHAQDAEGVTVFDVSPVTFSPNVEMPDPDGMPGVCYLNPQA